MVHAVHFFHSILILRLKIEIMICLCNLFSGGFQSALYEPARSTIFIAHFFCISFIFDPIFQYTSYKWRVCDLEDFSWWIFYQYFLLFYPISSNSRQSSKDLTTILVIFCTYVPHSLSLIIFSDSYFNFLFSSSKSSCFSFYIYITYWKRTIKKLMTIKMHHVSEYTGNQTWGLFNSQKCICLAWASLTIGHKSTIPSLLQSLFNHRPAISFINSLRRYWFPNNPIKIIDIVIKLSLSLESMSITFFSLSVAYLLTRVHQWFTTVNV